ncbi:MAG TPA: DUF3606 domain-containing protein [Xanthobacteraceae bacterium]|nr:DUF3606 domain-containing protein [Xanthobacteraceae bacterium]
MTITSPLRLVPVSLTTGAIRPDITVDTREGGATARWASRLGISEEALHAAIAEVGPSIAAVRRHLLLK